MPGQAGAAQQKYCVAWQGNPHELGRKLHAGALRRSLAQASQVFVMADGGVWIWNIFQDRFSHATGVWQIAHTIGAASAHGDPDVRRFQGGCVIDAVARDHDDPNAGRRTLPDSLGDGGDKNDASFLRGPLCHLHGSPPDGVLADRLKFFSQSAFDGSRRVGVQLRLP
ncbi:MAG: hypothetical protein NTY46_00015 [Candidatus Sumerlaeota bacterium]|nr:hypothetical protein [Candidatus Sumerlaeota bacterium]